MIESYRRINGSDQTDRRFYISSALKSAQEFLDLTREHWGIENRLHWVLDVAFREDQCRVRSGYAAQNFATLRHIALNLLKKDKSMKGGIKSKRLQIAWDPNRLLSLLGKI
jgi:predicted transposase YbfD/YdcC